MGMEEETRVYQEWEIARLGPIKVKHLDKNPLWNIKEQSLSCPGAVVHELQ